MKKFFNKIFRKDLNLNKKWWHRLFKVVFFLFMIVFVFIIRKVNKPSHGIYEEIIGSLSDYIKDNSQPSLVKLEDMFNKGIYIEAVKDGDTVYNKGDVRNRTYHSSTLYGEPEWIKFIKDYTSQSYLKLLWCKKGMSYEDIYNFKINNPGISKFFSQSSNKCELPSERSVNNFATSTFKRSSSQMRSLMHEMYNLGPICLIVNEGCLFGITEKAPIIDDFIVIKENSENAIKYEQKIYIKNLIYGIVETGLISLGVGILLLIIYYKGIIYVIYGDKGTEYKIKNKE